MAITNVIPIGGGRDGNVEYPQDGIIKKQYKQVFQVTTDNPEDDAGAIICQGQAAGLLPQFYAPYFNANFSDLECVCKNINPAPTESQYIWTVTCHFDNEPYLPANSPLCLPPVWSVSFQRTKEALEYDINNNPPLNSALVPLALERDISLLNIQVKWNSVNWNPDILVAIQDTLNVNTWHGFPPGTVKLDGFTVSEQTDPYRAGQGLPATGGLSGMPEVPGTYYEKNLSLSVKWDGWQARVLDAGLYQLDPRARPVPGRPPPLIPCEDRFGAPVTQPMPLDGFGHQLAFGRTPIYKTILIYRPINWEDITDNVFGKIHYGKLIDWPSIKCPERDSLACS